MDRDFELVSLVVNADVDLGHRKGLPVGRVRPVSECYEVLIAIVDIRSAWPITFGGAMRRAKRIDDVNMFALVREYSSDLRVSGLNQ